MPWLRQRERHHRRLLGRERRERRRERRAREPEGRHQRQQQRDPQREPGQRQAHHHREPRLRPQQDRGDRAEHGGGAGEGQHAHHRHRARPGRPERQMHQRCRDQRDPGAGRQRHQGERSQNPQERDTAVLARAGTGREPREGRASQRFGEFGRRQGGDLGPHRVEPDRPRPEQPADHETVAAVPRQHGHRERPGPGGVAREPVPGRQAGARAVGVHAVAEANPQQARDHDPGDQRPVPAEQDRRPDRGRDAGDARHDQVEKLALEGEVAAELHHADVLEPVDHRRRRQRPQHGGQTRFGEERRRRHGQRRDRRPRDRAPRGVQREGGVVERPVGRARAHHRVLDAEGRQPVDRLGEAGRQRHQPEIGRGEQAHQGERAGQAEQAGRHPPADDPAGAARHAAERGGRGPVRPVRHVPPPLHGRPQTTPLPAVCARTPMRGKCRARRCRDRPYRHGRLALGPDASVCRGAVTFRRHDMTQRCRYVLLALLAAAPARAAPRPSRRIRSMSAASRGSTRSATPPPPRRCARPGVSGCTCISTRCRRRCSPAGSAAVYDTFRRPGRAWPSSATASWTTPVFTGTQFRAFFAGPGQRSLGGTGQCARRLHAHSRQDGRGLAAPGGRRARARRSGCSCR